MNSSPTPDLNDLLAAVIDRGASDLHLQVGQAPVLRISGEMTPHESPPLTPEHTQEITSYILPPICRSAWKRREGRTSPFPTATLPVSG